MSFPDYPTYRDSGVEWIGQMPIAWTAQRISFLFGEVGSGTTPPTDTAAYYDGGIPWVTTGELREEPISDTLKKLTREALDAFPTLRVYPAGTLLIAMYGATIGRLGWLARPACTNQACCALAKPQGVEPRFAYYALLAAQEALLLLSSGGGQPNINQEKIRAFRIPVPSPDEQSAITSLLDHETAKIDALMAEQERLIALLAEKRQAVISQAVTKGLNPDVPMKDSGIDWLGQVPAHWEVVPLYSRCTFTPGKAHEPFIDEEGQHVCVTARFVSTQGVDQKRCSENLSPAQQGETLMVMSDLPNGRALARAYYVADSVSYAVNQRVCIISPGDEYPRFVYYVLDRNPWLMQNDDGVNQTHLSNDDFRKLPLRMPPYREQMAIAAFLDDQTSKFDSLTAEATRAIALLRERRAALISAAVTGKIDVRHFALAVQAAA